MPKALKVVLAVLVVLAVALGGASFYLAKSVARPNGNSLAEEQAWEEDHGMWGDFAELPREDFTVAGEGGYTLHCSLVPAAEASDRYVIISHGYNANRYGAAKYVTAYRDLGFNCIIYDLRGHGENERTFTTYGIREGQDIAELVKDTRKRYPKISQLGLHGESLGAASTAASMKYRPEVDFAVADCGFADIDNVLRGAVGKGHLPSFFVDLANLGSTVLYHCSFGDMRPVDSLDDCKVPFLFIHGAQDDFIDPENSRRMSERLAGCSEVHLIEGAKHANSVLTDPVNYRRYVEGFLGRL